MTREEILRKIVQHGVYLHLLEEASSALVERAIKTRKENPSHPGLQDVPKLLARCQKAYNNKKWEMEMYSAML